MEIAVILFIILGVISGLTKGAGVLQENTLNVTVGETVTFTTTLTPPEHPFRSVEWKVDGSQIFFFNGLNDTAPEYEGRITIMSAGSLELRNVTVNDSGEYTLSITPFGELEQTGATTLNVYVPVSNVTVTANSTDLVEFNSSLRLFCSSSGSSLSFLWLNSSSEVTASDRVQLTDGGTNLTIVNVTHYDQGPFRCHVFNPASNGTSNPVNFSISYGPESTNLTISPSKEYFEKGSNISLSCSAVSTPSAMFYWFLNGHMLSDTGPELRLMNIQMNQSGNYSCQAFNSKTLRYETSHPSLVSVLERISGASVTPSANLAIEGNPVNLTCDAAGSVLTRKWMKDGSDLSVADNIILYNERRVLSFHPLKKTDSGEYSCIISNPVSSDGAKYIMIVNYGPENVHIKGPSQISLGEKFTLNCFAESTPSASYTWTLNGVEIHNSSVFVNYNTEPSDIGNYTCQAMNKITSRTSFETHVVTVIPDKTSPCSAGCIAGIVIACLVVCGAAAGGGYYIYRKKINNKAPPHSGNEDPDEHVYESTSVYNKNL